MKIQTEELSGRGYSIVDDFLPSNNSDLLSGLFNAESQWVVHDQKDAQLYNTDFKTEVAHCPEPGEEYKAKFKRSYALENDPRFRDIFTGYFIPMFKQVSPFEVVNFDVLCYRMDAGDHYRIHIDSFAGSISAIFYANRKWCWDWGGILNIITGDSCYPVCPKFNRVVLLNNKIFKLPHFVTSVEAFAKNPRYAVVAFARTNSEPKRV